MNHEKTIARQRERRRFRVRRAIRGNSERPRLAVYRSHKHLYAQIINDDAGNTLTAASTEEKSLRGEIKFGGNAQAAQKIGQVIAERAIAQGIKQVAFDRREYKYHGRIAALADAARAAGLDF